MSAVSSKQYNSEGILIYEGGFEEDVRHGNGKSINPEDGSVIFEGGFMGGEPAEGVVTKYAEDGKTKLYQGGVVDGGTREGFGVEFYPNEENLKKYMGVFKADKYEHSAEEEKKAILWNEDGSKNYEGTFLDGLKSGEGI